MTTQKSAYKTIARVRIVCICALSLALTKSRYPQQTAMYDTFECVRSQQLYESVVKENIPFGFRSHVFVLRLMGLWPSTNDSPKYKWLTIGITVAVGILLPLLLFANVFYVDTIPDIMDQQCFSLTCLATVFKAAVLYWRRDNIRHFFRIHVKLMHDVSRTDRIIGKNQIAHVSLTMLNMSAWAASGIQIFLSEPGEAFLPSTANFPYDFAQRRSVYWLVLAYQILGGFIIGVCATATLDSFYLAAMNTACGHVAELKERLGDLGTRTARGDDCDLRFYQELVVCCKRYENCSR